MVEYSDEKAFELVKKIVGLAPERNVSWLYFFGDIAFEEDETGDGNKAVYFQIPSRRKTYDFGGKIGVAELGSYASGYYDLVKKRIVTVQIPPEDPEEEYIFLDVDWTISKLRSFLGWYGVDINALNWLHKDKQNIKNAIRTKHRMYPHIVEDIKTRRWLEPFKNEKIPKKEIEAAHKDLLEYLDFTLKERL